MLSAKTFGMKIPSRLVDALGMIEHNALILFERPECLEILQAYAAREQKIDVADDSSWSPRLAVNTEEQTELPQTSSESHGLLIAFGYLDIELADRTSGIQYRISAEGKRALAKVDQQNSVEDRVAEQISSESGETSAEDDDLQAA